MPKPEEVIREALMEFSYKPQREVDGRHSKYEAATAAVDALVEARDSLRTQLDEARRDLASRNDFDATWEAIGLVRDRAVRAEDERDRLRKERDEFRELALAQVLAGNAAHPAAPGDVYRERDRLREALRLARKERDEVYAVNAATNYDRFKACAEALEEIIDTCEPHRIPLPLLNSKVIRCARAALAGAAVQTGRATGENSSGDDQRSSIAEVSEG